MADSGGVVIANLSPHDREMLREFYGCFDRAAFKVNFEHESDLDATVAALADTVAALGTGIKTRRDGVLFGKTVEGKAYFESRALRVVFDEIVDVLCGVQILYSHAKAAGFFFVRSPTSIAFHSDHSREAARVALLVDEARNRVLELVNQVYVPFGYREYAYIRSPEYYDGYDEIQALKKKAQRRKYMSILDVLTIKPSFFGVGLNVSALLKAISGGS